MKELSKMSIKTVVGNKTTVLEILGKGKGKAVPIMRVAGIVFKITTGTSDTGDWTALKGKFQGVNLLTNEVFESSTLYLPEKYTTETALRLVSGKSKTVNLGIDIYVKPNKDREDSYTYDGVNHVEDKSSDAISSMLKNLPKLKSI